MEKIYLFLSLMLSLFLAACSSTNTHMEEVTAEPTALNATVSRAEKLGTKWGDELRSNVTEVNLKRLSSSPIAESQVRYASKTYTGKAVNSISLAAGKISFSIINDAQRPLPLFRDGQQYYLSGKDGQSYQLKYQNHSNSTFEVVASVDGLDVINGRSASRSNSGYVLRPQGELIIEGFRKSDSAVASFTFSRPEEAYAANSDHGSIQNTGVIGTVIYPLESAATVDKATDASKYAPPPKAFPAD